MPCAGNKCAFLLEEEKLAGYEWSGHVLVAFCSGDPDYGNRDVPWNRRGKGNGPFRCCFLGFWEYVEQQPCGVGAFPRGIARRLPSAAPGQSGRSILASPQFAYGWHRHHRRFGLCGGWNSVQLWTSGGVLARTIVLAIPSHLAAVEKRTCTFGGCLAFCADREVHENERPEASCSRPLL